MEAAPATESGHTIIHIYVDDVRCEGYCSCCSCCDIVLSCLALAPFFFSWTTTQPKPNQAKPNQTKPDVVYLPAFFFIFHWSTLPSVCARCNTKQLNGTRRKTRVVGIFVSNEPREDSWAAAIDPTGSVLDHLQIPRQRDAKAKKLKVINSNNSVHARHIKTYSNWLIVRMACSRPAARRPLLERVVELTYVCRNLWQTRDTSVDLSDCCP